MASVANDPNDRRRLIEYFGADNDMARVTPADCEDFRLHLDGKGS